MLQNNDYITIFHEIKNSITLIGSSLQLIEKKHPEVAGYDHWSESRAELNHLKQIVTELSAARSNASVRFTLTSVSDFLSETLSSVQFFAPEDFFCELTLEDDLPDIEIDPVRIHQALVNLIKNSFEAMNHSGTIKLSVFREGSFVLFELTDHGGGIPDEYGEHIFEPLFTSKPDGSGLGLTITKDIIEAHHGALTFSSRPGDGCTFTIRLPIRQN